MNICDDKADTNANLACGRKAGSDGSLAILGSIGSFDGGVTASKLPAIFVNGTSPFELTNKNAYSSVNGIALGISGTSAIKARGRKSSTLVLPDTPTLQFAGQLIVKMAALLKVKVDPIYYPQDTTDFAPVAAQISQADDEAVGMLPLNPVVVVNALAQEGITPENHDMVVPGGVITPESLKELGDAANGILVVSEAMPPTETSNKGIAEFRADMKADGKDPDDPNVDAGTVTSWSNVKKLEGALLAAGPKVIASLDSKSVVDAVVNHPVDRPETAPYDFRKHAIPEVPELAALPRVHPHRRGAPDRGREVQGPERRLHRHPEAPRPVREELAESRHQYCPPRLAASTGCPCRRRSGASGAVGAHGHVNRGATGEHLASHCNNRVFAGMKLKAVATVHVRVCIARPPARGRS